MSTLLVVDDEEMIRKLIRRMVEPIGWRVLEAASASEGDVLMQEQGANVAISLVDVSLPDINGADLAAQWVSEYAGLKVVLISGYPVEPSLLVPGRIFFLPKPFTRENLHDLLQAAGG